MAMLRYSNFAPHFLGYLPGVEQDSMIMIRIFKKNAKRTKAIEFGNVH